MSDFSLPKSERLSSKNLIDQLFQEGKSLFVYPYSIKYLEIPELTNNQFLVSVSKKKFKRAVDRNLIKRRIKEAYRLNKSESLENRQDECYMLIGYIYTAKEIHNYNFIESKLIESLKRLNPKHDNKK